MGNFMSAIIRAYRPIKSFNYIINRSRLYNSYDAIFEILLCITNYAFFSLTNQMVIIHSLLVETLIALVGNYIVHITPAMRFIYSVILSSIALLLQVVLISIIFTRQLNLLQVCSLLKNFKRKNPNEAVNGIEICIEQSKYYFIWLLFVLISMVLRGTSIYFGIQAHNFVKNKKMVRAHKRNKNTE